MRKRVEDRMASPLRRILRLNLLGFKLQERDTNRRVNEDQMKIVMGEDGHDLTNPVSYTHLTLPTKLEV